MDNRPDPRADAVISKGNLLLASELRGSLHDDGRLEPRLLELIALVLERPGEQREQRRLARAVDADQRDAVPRPPTPGSASGSDLRNPRTPGGAYATADG